jgi:hypothetical protein
MLKKVLIMAAIAVFAVSVSSCGVKRDCAGNKKTYYKSGGFWM